MGKMLLAHFFPKIDAIFTPAIHCSGGVCNNFNGRTLYSRFINFFFSPRRLRRCLAALKFHCLGLFFFLGRARARNISNDIIVPPVIRFNGAPIVTSASKYRRVTQLAIIYIEYYYFKSASSSLMYLVEEIIRNIEMHLL